MERAAQVSGGVTTPAVIKNPRGCGTLGTRSAVALGNILQRLIPPPPPRCYLGTVTANDSWTSLQPLLVPSPVNGTETAFVPLPGGQDPPAPLL